MDSLFIVMPAYNEEANIENVIRQWHPVAERLSGEGVCCRIVVANDGSKDQTSERLHQLVKLYPYLEAIDKPNSGHGGTVLFLYHYALSNGATYVFQTDSDGQTLPEEFYPMWNNRQKADFHIGFRYGRKDGFSRVVVTKVLRLVVLMLFGVWVKDANTPFRLMNANQLKTVMQYIPDGFFLSNVAISAIAVKRHFHIQWYPITFRPRQGGVNSINLKRIFGIGKKALAEFYSMNRNLTKTEKG